MARAIERLARGKLYAANLPVVGGAHGGRRGITSRAKEASIHVKRQNPCRVLRNGVGRGTDNSGAHSHHRNLAWCQVPHARYSRSGLLGYANLKDVRRGRCQDIVRNASANQRAGYLRDEGGGQLQLLRAIDNKNVVRRNEIRSGDIDVLEESAQCRCIRAHRGYGGRHGGHNSYRRRGRDRCVGHGCGRDDDRAWHRKSLSRRGGCVHAGRGADRAIGTGRRGCGRKRPGDILAGGVSGDVASRIIDGSGIHETLASPHRGRRRRNDDADSSHDRQRGHRIFTSIGLRGGRDRNGWGNRRDTVGRYRGKDGRGRVESVAIDGAARIGRHAYGASQGPGDRRIARSAYHAGEELSPIGNHTGDGRRHRDRNGRRVATATTRGSQRCRQNEH